MAEDLQQQPRGTPPFAGQRRIPAEQHLRIAMRDLDQPLVFIRVLARVEQPRARQPRLPRAERIATTARAQILLGNDEAIVGIAQHHQALLLAMGQAGRVHQQAG